MTTGPSGGQGPVFKLSVRQIVIAGILGGIAIFLGYTRLGFIPVPNLAGNATIMHVPAILGGALEGPVVGTIVGGIFGIFSFIQAGVPFFRDPLVSILPRLLIGVVAWAAFVGLKNVSLDLASAASGVLGSLTNTVGVLGMAVLLGYLPLAAVVPVVVVRGVMLVRSGQTTAAETDADEERRY